jgi:hypothetical protein
VTPGCRITVNINRANYDEGNRQTQAEPPHDLLARRRFQQEYPAKAKPCRHHGDPRQKCVRHQHLPAESRDNPRLVQKIPNPGGPSELRCLDPVEAIVK